MGIGYVALCIFSPDSGRGNPYNRFCWNTRGVLPSNGGNCSSFSLVTT